MSFITVLCLHLFTILLFVKERSVIVDVQNYSVCFSITIQPVRCAQVTEEGELVVERWGDTVLCINSEEFPSLLVEEIVHWDDQEVDWDIWEVET